MMIYIQAGMAKRSFLCLHTHKETVIQKQEHKVRITKVNEGLLTPQIEKLQRLYLVLILQ